MDQRGFIGIMIVLIVLVITLGISITMVLLGISEMQSGYQASQALNRLSIADGCAEEAYLRLKRDGSYVGGTVSLGAFNCDVTVTGTDPDRNIVSGVNVGNFSQTVDTDLTIEQNTGGEARAIDVTSWGQ